MTDDERAAREARKEERRRLRSEQVASGAAKSFTVREIAQRHNISHVTVYAEINEGRLRSFKRGRHRRVSEQAEADWIDLLEEATSA